MRKLLVAPSQAGYAAQPGNTVVSIALPGGKSRNRRDFIGAVAQVSAVWNLPPLEYDYLAAFYRSVTEESLLTFEIDLILDSWKPQTYQARFVPGTFALTGTSGMKTTASAQLEVIPLPVDRELDLALVDLFELYGYDAADVLNELDLLVNVRIPGAVAP